MEAIADVHSGARFDPPVKLACLPCRASRIRCDGKPVCRNCSNRDRQCVYTKSRRGGPRISRRLIVGAATTEKASSKEKQPAAPPSNAVNPSIADAVEAMIFPGAGLATINKKKTDDEFPKQSPLDRTRSQSSSYTVRKYRSDADILNAYFIFVHAYFPVLPPSSVPIGPDMPSSDLDCEHQPASPVSLAISAVLALIPHPLDIKSTDDGSCRQRREHAQLLAQLAMDSFEIDSELLESTLEPSEALSGSRSRYQRKPFHPSVPLELEGLLALLILSVYEYAQRGNLVKMRNRASQALDAAIRMSLHELNPLVEDQYSEANRRAWWMTFMTVLQSAIVSNTKPLIDASPESFCTPLPICDGDSSVWAALLDSQVMIMRCTLYTVALKESLDRDNVSTGHHSSILGLDTDLDRRLVASTWSLGGNTAVPMSQTEAAVIISLKAQTKIKLHSAKIKLHRYTAFRDAPIFDKRHCDLSSAADREGAHVAGCPPGTSQSSTGRGPSLASHVSHTSDALESAKLCLHSALAISKAFDALPLPVPNTTDEFSWIPDSMVPRTMPSFACCAMQGSYVLLMLCLKNRSVSSPKNSKARGSMDALHMGLRRILEALDNYSLAFEAIQGMRNEVRDSIEAIK
ncbi:hypothetical protein BDV96DRAFT_207041 [Lophiotrema nucula]|uniref:Zn(2)-C6 fungal-type domain-containing protein n=1 Tax=Lophiotrema nucula TaxID=690887 RepID=A0A6A5ZNK4_9PLEO|nr:hypothetical protein BDV96DRAFT_207041 [Lophiotrema nucula]